MHLNSVTVAKKPSDVGLVARILSGDMRAMEELVRLHNRILFRTARPILRHDAASE